ncbi:MAG TPA: exopolysaccharide biosynthesis polyprenyl glycosylphosphotransferase [Acidimicrobiales bacterium]|nr:exopolysaccharide biosynthesis polyprenyl glycosylphosphotransferase [Acidimicrobiales bacterium]
MTPPVTGPGPDRLDLTEETAIDSPGWYGRYVAALTAADVAAAMIAGYPTRAWLAHRVAAAGGGVALFPSLLLALAWIASMLVSGAYDRRIVGLVGEEARRVLGATARFVGVTAAIVVASGSGGARAAALRYTVIATALSLAAHLAGAFWLTYRRRLGACRQRVLLVGTMQRVADVARRLQAGGSGGVDVVGACVSGCLTGDVTPFDVGVPVLGAVDALDARRLSAFDAVVLADDDTAIAGDLRDLLRHSALDVLVAPPATVRPRRRPSAWLLAARPLEPHPDGADSVTLVAIGMIERAVAALLLLAILPILVVAALAVRATSRGPALFSQVRLGQGGRRFTLWKLRTMGVDAEAQRPGVAHLNEHDGLLFKIRRDPRITPVGRVLRRFSIDELPQLWNVVRGEMRLVGPRPPLPDEVDFYDRIVSRRLLVKPGLTGLWQVNGRADLSWVDGIDLDLRYVDTRTPAGDLAILCKTVTAIVRGRGAY